MSSVPGDLPVLLGELDTIELANMIRNIEAKARAPAHIDVQESGGVPPTTKATPVPTKGTAGIKPIGVTESVTAAEPEALEPWTRDKDNTVPQDNMPMGEGVLEALLPHRDTVKCERRPNTPKRKRKRSTLPQEGKCIRGALPKGCPTGHSTTHERKPETPWQEVLAEGSCQRASPTGEGERARDAVRRLDPPIASACCQRKSA